MIRGLSCVVVAFLVAATLWLVGARGDGPANPVPPSSGSVVSGADVSTANSVASALEATSRVDALSSIQLTLSIQTHSGAAIAGAKIALARSSGSSVTASDVGWESDEFGQVRLSVIDLGDEETNILSRLLISAPGYQIAWAGDVAHKVASHAWLAVMVPAAIIQARLVGISGLPMSGVMVGVSAAALPSERPRDDSVVVAPGPTSAHWKTTGPDGIAAFDKLCVGVQYHLGIVGGDVVLTGRGEKASAIMTTEARSYDIEVQCAAVLACVFDISHTPVNWRAESANGLVSDSMASGTTMPIRLSLRERWPTCSSFLVLTEGPDLRDGWVGMLVGSLAGKEVWRGQVNLLPPSRIAAPLQILLAGAKDAMGTVLVRIVDPSGAILDGIAFRGMRGRGNTHMAGHSGVAVAAEPGSYRVELSGLSGLKSCFTEQFVEVIAGQQHVVEFRTQKVLRKAVVQVRLPDGSSPSYAIVEFRAGTDVRGIRSMRPNNIQTWLPVGNASVTVRVYGYAAVTQTFEITETESGRVVVELRDTFDGWDSRSSK
jgi:hypothetical protein